MREVERSAASVEEAVEAALEELGASEQEVEVEILQEPRGGFLRLGSQEAVVRVRVSEPGDSAPTEDELEEQADIAADFLDGLFEAMELDADVEPRLVEGSMYVDIWGVEGAEGMGALIGRHGLTLEALQDAVRSVVQRRTGDRCRVVVDVEDYRKRRLSQLASRAQNIARKVRRTGRPERLEPMTSFERKIVHDAVARVGGVQTASEGDEPERRIVIRRAGRGVPRETPGAARVSVPRETDV